jgi:hypothetical protein
MLRILKLMLHPQLLMVGKNLLRFSRNWSSNNYQRVVVSLILTKEQELLITLMILNNLIKNIKDEK